MFLDRKRKDIVQTIRATKKGIVIREQNIAGSKMKLRLMSTVENELEVDITFLKHLISRKNSAMLIDELGELQHSFGLLAKLLSGALHPIPTGRLFNLLN